MYIVDARVRPPIRMYSKYYNLETVQRRRKKLGIPSEDPALMRKDAQLLVQQMKEAGVRHAVVPGRAPNPTVGGGDPESLLELMRANAGYVTGLTGVDALSIEDPGRFAAETIKAGFKGFVVESGLGAANLPIDHSSNFPLYEAAQSVGLIVYAMGGGGAGPDISFSNPLYIDRIALNFPDLQIVVPHGGYPHVQEIGFVLYRRANVWLLPDMYFPGAPGEADYLLLAKSWGQDRFLFGTSYPSTTHDVHIRRYLELPLSDAVKEKVMGLNAARLFKLPV